MTVTRFVITYNIKTKPYSLFNLLITLIAAFEIIVQDNTSSIPK